MSAIDSTRSVYGPEERERGLTALILAGSSPKASEVTGIPEATLRAWKRDHSARYEQLQDELEPRIVKKIAAEAENIVLRLAHIQHKAIDQLEGSIDELKPAELAAASRNLATTSALYIDKHSSPLRERPSHVQQGRDLDQVVSAMARLVGFDATSTATEIVDAPLPLNASDPHNGGPQDRLNAALIAPSNAPNVRDPAAS
jgi:hypothetical protein